MSSIVFVTFDIKKDDYPSIPYSVAAMIASLQVVGHKVSHYSFDLQHARDEKNTKTNMTEAVTSAMISKIEFFKRFEFIAISLTAWTIEYVNELLSMLPGYNGKIILGGYEVTAMCDSDLLKHFSTVSYFIKGYSETALRKILSGEILTTDKILKIPVKNEDTASPYQTGIIPLYSRKIHWETKRGCPFKCGFCEWGNSSKNVFDFETDRIKGDIELFKKSTIEEINILDGTFNWGKNYVSVFKQLLEIPDLKITCQARFESLFRDSGVEFFSLCQEHKSRVHLEFGLQSIHEKECEIIGRDNNIEEISRALKMLNENGINYEVSIIYAIPGQTIHSFIDTIEFLIDNGCKTIRAYPLRIPKNSDLEKKKRRLR